MSREKKMADSPSKQCTVCISTRAKPCGRDGEDTVIFKQPNLPADAFPAIADIRRQGKLCDVTLKVNS